MKQMSRVEEHSGSLCSHCRCEPMLFPTLVNERLVSTVYTEEYKLNRLILFSGMIVLTFIKSEFSVDKSSIHVPPTRGSDIPASKILRVDLSGRVS